MVTQGEKNQHLSALMQAGQQGNSASYRQFLDEISHDIRRFLSGRLAAEEVDDVVQETLVSLHKARHTYDGKRAVVPWVFAIARFRLTDHLRKHYAQRQHKQVDVDDVPEKLLSHVTEGAPRNEYLDKAIETLPERQQKILYLMHTEGYTAKEVGGQLGMNESAVKVAAHRAYKVIRKKMGANHE